TRWRWRPPPSRGARRPLYSIRKSGRRRRVHMLAKGISRDKERSQPLRHFDDCSGLEPESRVFDRQWQPRSVRQKPGGLIGNRLQTSAQSWRGFWGAEFLYPRATPLHDIKRQEKAIKFAIILCANMHIIDDLQ